MQVDAQKVINNLGAELASRLVENATLKAQVEMLQAENAELKSGDADEKALLEK